MTRDEHAAAIELGLRLEPGMRLGVRWDDGDAVHPARIVERLEDGRLRCVDLAPDVEPGDEVFTIGPCADGWHDDEGLWADPAPDLTDPATYRAGVAQWLARVPAEGVRYSQAGYLLAEPDPARLADLLRETAGA